MTFLLRRTVVAISVLAMGLSGMSNAHAGNPATMARHTSTAAGNVDWPHFGNTSDNTHFSPLTQITPQNVNKLGLAWTMPEGKGLSVWETFPIVVGGTMYITTNTDQVMALNAATGKLIWRYTPAVNFYEAVAGGGAGVAVNRGVEVINGKVYLLTFDDQLIALQAATGEVIWKTIVSKSSDGYSETSPPTYWNGLLIIPSAGSDAGLRGFVAAYNANTGKQVWRYYTIPAAGHGWVPRQGAHGGGTPWMPITVDTQTGRLYFGTGNPSPDNMGSIRPGCNPWADATVALDARTGKFLWGHSQVCNDSYDYDSMQPPMLLTVYKNGKAIRAVGEGNKEGFYWIFDAATGKVLAKSPALSKQTKNRQRPTAAGITICPGSAGGIEYSPAAYNAKLHMIFQPTLNFCQIYSSITAAEAAKHRLGAIDVGGNISNGPGPYDGNMAAISSDTGKLLWYTHVNGPMIGGALATESGLVFSGSDDTHLYAFDAKTGKILWKPKLGLAFGAAPIAYQVNGTEYIAVATGGNDIAPGYTTALGGTFAVFKLGGKPIHPFPASNSGTFVPESPQLPSLKGLKLVDKFMYVDPVRQHVVIKAIAAYDSSNSGFNFDGYSRGKANFTVPVGWNVEFLFSNKQSLPHSLGVTSDLKTPPTEPFFGFLPVQTPNANVGVGPNSVQIAGLTASHSGRYHIVCLVPGHLQSGMWDNFTVSSTATMPSIQVSK